jgi:hypothetical protein
VPLIRPVGDLQPEAVRIEDEERPVPGLVAILRSGGKWTRVELEAAAVNAFQLLARVDVEREVLEPDVVVPMRAAVCRPQAEAGPVDAEVGDLIRDREVEMVQPSDRHRSEASSPVAAAPVNHPGFALRRSG